MELNTKGFMYLGGYQCLHYAQKTFDTIKKAKVWQCSECKEKYLSYKPKCEICELRQLSEDIRNGKSYMDPKYVKSSGILSLTND